MTSFTLWQTCCNSNCDIIHVSQQEHELGNSYKYEAIVNLDITYLDFHEITSAIRVFENHSQCIKRKQCKNKCSNQHLR